MKCMLIIVFSVSLPFLWVDIFIDRSPINLTQTNFHERNPSWSPSGEKILFEADRDGNWDIFVMDKNGSNVKKLTNSSFDDRYPAWSPSGTKVVFTRFKKEESLIYILNLVNLSFTELPIPIAGDPLYSNWSPDGNWIVITLKRGDNFNLYKIQFETNELHQLTDHPARDIWPRWSPNGEFITFFSRRDTDGVDDELYTIKNDGSQIKRITTKPGHDFCPVWSPEGDKLAAASISEEFGRGIAVFELSGMLDQIIGLGFDRATEPSWSPTGDAIIYAARKSSSYDIYVEKL